MNEILSPHPVRQAGLRTPGELFRDALDGFDRSRPVLVMGHNDADGLAAMAILTRSLAGSGRPCRTRIVGRGENPWSDPLRDEVTRDEPGGLIVADLGLRDGEIAPRVPTIIIDHHVPTGRPSGATVITGFGQDPVPTSSLLAYRCAEAIGAPGPMLWLAALGILGDMAEDEGFPEMAEARNLFGITALRKAASLVNAPRRSASGDAAPALALLTKANGPKEVLSGEHPETAALFAARDEVKAELERTKRVGPSVRGEVALIRFTSPCQIHPLVAQAWRARLKNSIVLAANDGFRPGWVHFAARSARRRNLVAYLAEHAPPGADENYGSGHEAATGGALRPADWNHFVRSLGFSAEQEVPA